MKSVNGNVVLYVDDEEINLELFKMSFTGLYHVVTCNSPKKALEIINHKKINLLITDYKMPGMNGMELILEVKKSRPDIICIILSGYVESEVVTDRNLLYKYILKPWKRNEFADVMHTALSMYKAD